MFTTDSYTFAVLNGSQTQVPIAFKFFENTDLEAYLNGSLTTAYVVAGAGNDAGGTLTFYSPPVANTVAFIRRVTRRYQPLDYQGGAAFPAETLEQALDRLTAHTQDVYEELSRRPALAIATAAALRSLTFPAPVPNGILAWNADGTGLTIVAPTIFEVTVDPTSGETHGKATATLTATGGEAILTAAALAPAGAKIKWVGYRCLTDFDTSLGLTSVDLGGMGITSGWGSALGIVTDAVNNAGHMRGDEPNTVDAEDISLLPNGGLFGPGGSAKITVAYRLITPDA